MSCPTPSTKSPGSSVHGIFPGKNTGLGCRFLLQRIFPTQGSNWHLLNWQVDSLLAEPPGKHSHHTYLGMPSLHLGLPSRVFPNSWILFLFFFPAKGGLFRISKESQFRVFNQGETHAGPQQKSRIFFFSTC